MMWHRALAIGLVIAVGGDVVRVAGGSLPSPSSLRDPEILSSDWLANWMVLRSFDPDSRTFVIQLQLKSITHAAIGNTEIARVGDGRTAALVAITAGANRDYLLKIAQRESAMNPRAKANRSSAAGLFQFTENTWLCMLLDAGPRLGINAGFGLIRTGNGRCRAADESDRIRLLAMRYDPVLSTKMASAFTSINDDQFMETFGRRPNDDERYVLHVFGAAAGTRLIQLAASNPGLVAATFFPAAARANPSIFYDGRGRARNVAEVVITLGL
jgi:hypothetical protein